MGPTVTMEAIRVVSELNSTLSPYEGFEYSSATEPVSFNVAKGGLHKLTQTVNSSGTVVSTAVVASADGVFESKLIIPLYVVIFLLSVIGNSLVLITLVQNKRMRTVTNVYLLNLAVSDLLLGVFCMPFTLVGQVLRNFIFGAAMCKMIPYFQAVSVSVAVWTLVAISLERYFAICRPLKSRRWQTQFHAYKMIVVVWLGSLTWSAPVLVVSSLKAMKGRGYKCREEWPSESSERAYNLFLDAMLLLVPLIFMSLAYSLIMSKLWKGLRREIQHNTSCQQQMLDRSSSSLNVNGLVVRNNNTSTATMNSLASVRQNRLIPPTMHLANDKRKKIEQKGKNKKEAVKMWLMKGIVQGVFMEELKIVKINRIFKNGSRSSIDDYPLVSIPSAFPRIVEKLVAVRLPTSNKRGYCNYSKTKSSLVPGCEVGTTTDRSPVSSSCNEDCAVDETTYTFSRHAIRSNYMGKSIEAKRKVIRMLFVVVAEFFICWAPIHILNTWYLFYPEAVYKYVGSTGISLVQLLAYISSCCNPITYCFMNRKFRQAFVGMFHCCRCCCCCLDNDINTPGSKTQRSGTNRILQNNSDVSGNDSTVYVGRASTLGRSEVVVLEAEDRV